MSTPPPDRPPASPRADDAATRPLYRLALFSLLGGSTSLLPLPVVDDWALAWVRRRLILEVCRPRLALGDSALRILLNRGREEPRRGCAGIMLRTPISFVLYLLGRLFRKIFFFLAIKESTDRAAALFLEGYLLSNAAGTTRLHPQVIRGEPAGVRQLAFAVGETLQETDSSPIRVLVVQASRGSRRLLFAAARRLRRFLRRSSPGQPETLVAEEEKVLEEPVRRLTRLLEEQWPFFRALEGRFREFARRRGVFVNGEGGTGARPVLS